MTYGLSGQHRDEKGQLPGTAVFKTLLFTDWWVWLSHWYVTDGLTSPLNMLKDLTLVQTTIGRMHWWQQHKREQSQPLSVYSTQHIAGSTVLWPYSSNMTPMSNNWLHRPWQHIGQTGEWNTLTSCKPRELGSLFLMEAWIFLHQTTFSFFVIF